MWFFTFLNVLILQVLVNHVYSADLRCPDNTQIDVTFFIDYVNSAGTGNWNKALQFVVDVIKQYKIGPNDARFAAVGYLKGAVTLYDLRSLTDYSSFDKALKGTGSQNFPALTDQVYNTILGWNMFSNKETARKSAKSAAIYITDGSSAYLNKSTNPLKNLNVKIVTIGIGSSVSVTVLKAQSSSPDDALLTASFDNLPDLKNKIIERTCGVSVTKTPATTTTRPTSATTRPTSATTRPTSATTRPTSATTRPASVATTSTTTTEEIIDLMKDEVTHPPLSGLTAPTGTPEKATNCPSTSLLDIVLVLDSSYTINAINWNNILQFAINLTSHFTVGPNAVRFAALAFSSRVWHLFKLDDVNTNAEVVTKLTGLPVLNQATMTNFAFDHIYTSKLFGVKLGGRDLAKDVILLITDGYATDRQATKDSAQLLKAQGVTIATVGVGPDILLDSLNEIATSKSDVFLVWDFPKLDYIRKKVVDRVCSYATNSTSG